MKEGFYRIAAAAPLVSVANPSANADGIIKLLHKAHDNDVDCIVLPELCTTAYTCADLFHNSTLLDAADNAIENIISASNRLLDMLIWVGAPLRAKGTLYNCAVAIANGNIIAAIPKTYIPNYNEFYEYRWFAPAPDSPIKTTIGEREIIIDPYAIISHKGVNVSAEICEDVWSPLSPSTELALNGAEVIVNLSASNDLAGKYNYLRNLIIQQSSRCLCAYAYASAGFGESSTDLVFDAKLLIADNGKLLAYNNRWQITEQMVINDVDIQAIRHDRLHNRTFAACCAKHKLPINIYPSNCYNGYIKNWFLIRPVAKHPFIPSDHQTHDDRCEEIIAIQTAALAKRLQATHCKSLTIGVSGGLDSTLALLIAVRAFDKLNLDRKGIIGVTMPGFGTTNRTHGNATILMDALGISSKEVSIVPAVLQHFKDIEHDQNIHDVTYENSQARQRTMLLMNIANKAGGMVLGTGDLSELALGWATYNGDHMSMYGINAGIPKTLVIHLTRWFAERSTNEDEKRALLDIIDTPISPELLPANTDGSIDQKTEDLVGPYELHDFFLYYTLRYGFRPRRILLLAENAFKDEYKRETIIKWERTFFRRFFAQQFKRSCLPDGPKVGSVCLSPRGDWRMPSDAVAEEWLNDLADL